MLQGATYIEPIVMIMPWGCVFSFQAEGAESMYGKYFSLGTLVQRNPKAFSPVLLSLHTLTLLTAHRIIKVQDV